MRKTLTTIVLAGAMALSSCTKGTLQDSRYDFDGKLGDEQVEFKTEHRGAKGYSSWDWNYLDVKREDGKNIIYVDKRNNLEVDKIIVNDVVYRNDAVGAEAIKLAQEQFDDYLTRILEYKQQKAIDALK